MLPVSHALPLTKFFSVETASTLLYAQQTTTAHLWSHPCFSDRLLILNEDSWCFQRIRKKDFAEVLEHFLTAGHLVFLRPFRAFSHSVPTFCFWISLDTVAFHIWNWRYKNIQSRNCTTLRCVTLPTVNQAFSPSNFLGSQTWRMYRAVNNPTNANSVHASVIRIPEIQKRKQCKFSLCGECRVMIGNDSMLCYSDFYSRLSLNGHLFKKDT